MWEEINKIFNERLRRADNFSPFNLQILFFVITDLDFSHILCIFHRNQLILMRFQHSNRRGCSTLFAAYQRLSRSHSFSLVYIYFLFLGALETRPDQTRPRADAKCSRQWVCPAAVSKSFPPHSAARSLQFTSIRAPQAACNARLWFGFHSPIHLPQKPQGALLCSQHTQHTKLLKSIQKRKMPAQIKKPHKEKQLHKQHWLQHDPFLPKSKRNKVSKFVRISLLKIT